MKFSVNKLLLLASLILASLLFINIFPNLSNTTAAPSNENKITFVAVGDMPYKKDEIAMLTAPHGSIVKAIKQLNPAVLVHFGDIKSGGAACSDELLIERREQLYHLLPTKTVFSPGDNDWTDCDRQSLSPRFNELERLNFLRENYYAGKGLKLTKGIKGLMRQDDFIENAAWTMNSLVFGTLNIPGTNNGRTEIILGDQSTILDEADRRDTMNEQWLGALFEQARKAKGLVITFQADIYQPSTQRYPVACSKSNRQYCDGYMKIRQLIERKSAQLDKPVLIIHGDTGAYCFHQPRVKQANKLWRLNGLGDFMMSDAAQISFNPSNKKSPFSVVSLLGQQSLPKVCDYND